MKLPINKKNQFKLSPLVLALAAATVSFHTNYAFSAEEIPPGFFKTPDGKIMANNPNTAVAPPGYYLRRNGTLIKLDPDLMDNAPAAPSVDIAGGEVPEGFHKMPDGQIMANDPANAVAPPGYHIMGNGILMSNSGGDGGGGHAHHHGGGHHGAGMWMFDLKYSFMHMKDMLDTTTKVTAAESVKATSEYNFMMAPVDMNMHMLMGMVMYGVTDKFMLMGMAHYMKNEMTMLTQDGTSSKMNTSGIADTVISGMLQIPYKLTLNIGLSLPTGSISEVGPMTHAKGVVQQDVRYPYGMQLGSGSYDIKHGISYTDSSKDIGWGGSYEYTSRLNKNKNDYKWGNLFLADSWIRWDVTNQFNTTAKLSLRVLGEMEGADPVLEEQNSPAGFSMMSPAMSAKNYGGRRLDFGLGAKYTISAYSVSGDFSMPVYQNLWGPQMATKWIASLNVGAMF